MATACTPSSRRRPLSRPPRSSELHVEAFASFRVTSGPEGEVVASTSSSYRLDLCGVLLVTLLKASSPVLCTVTVRGAWRLGSVRERRARRRDAGRRVAPDRRQGDRQVCPDLAGRRGRNRDRACGAAGRATPPELVASSASTPPKETLVTQRRGFSPVDRHLVPPVGGARVRSDRVDLWIKPGGKRMNSSGRVSAERASWWRAGSPVTVHTWEKSTTAGFWR